MDAQATAEILRAFDTMSDPRRFNRRYKLMDVFAIALFAILCGADGWVAVEEYGRAKQAWLKTFLDLSHGIPSHDTFGDVFAKLDPDAFEQCFQAWMSAIVKLGGGKLVSIDGNSLRHSFEHGWDKSGMSHMVSAFVEANRMVIAQVQTDRKGHELSGIEKLLKMIDLNGAVVTIDALGCNRTIAQATVRLRSRTLERGEQSALAVGRKLPRGRAKNPQRSWGGEFQSAVPDVTEPAEIGNRPENRHRDQTTNLWMEQRVFAKSRSGLRLPLKAIALLRRACLRQRRHRFPRRRRRWSTRSPDHGLSITGRQGRHRALVALPAISPPPSAHPGLRSLACPLKLTEDLQVPTVKASILSTIT